MQKRLMQELKLLDKCTSIKDGVFEVSLVNDNLFEWDVMLHKFDPDTLIAHDLEMMRRSHGVGSIWLRISFPQNFPFVPPFVRVLAPVVHGGFVLSGGAVCMELLTPDGWSQAYRMESVILQTMSTIGKGQARIVRQVRRPLTDEEAKRSYDHLVRVHKKHGWHTPQPGDG
ncbi:uncharacterized protein MONBRDRAFT_14240 [Monosiga brevicollis MX1]|uniref:E2 ubiquitin-conjugating enzyme n=1 Tax=Monosiga brevicollis TaxID=81824 RepID=A9USV4_MONBE|nr:uncharacterized protein MONBRDRAFT_14240 [Monosiga brevicollis MX1]EDQ92170.1 predicted protein [Monosiga brevicollis MX1]|eukprot:XP_001743456.1 hypothetical protein [Monosiga brevicollis MX1]